MRLTCPTCGAEYEIADAMIPTAGRHVQCTACHTRWFVRREVSPAEESEDEIVQRLEARSHIRAVPRPSAPVESPPESVPAAPEPPAPAPGPVPPPEDQAQKPAQPRPVAGADPAPVTRPAPSAPPMPSSPRAVPAKPAERPMQAGDGLTLRPAPRLDLGAEPKASPPRAVPQPSRFGRGLLLAVVLFGLALAAYAWRAELAARVPAAAPALEAYGRTVDGLRLELDRAIDDLRG